MKKIILIIGSLTFLFNVLLGLLLSGYPSFNMWVNCGIIALNTILTYSLYRLDMRDAFRITFSFLFASIAIVELVIGCLMPERLQDNGCLIAMVVLLFIEISLIAIANIMSNKIKK